MGANTTSTSVIAIGSGLGCQVMTTRVGGSQISTSPHAYSVPSSSRSSRRPPTRGSNTSSATRSSPIECVFVGHQVPIFSVKSVKAALDGLLHFDGELER